MEGNWFDIIRAHKKTVSQHFDRFPLSLLTFSPPGGSRCLDVCVCDCMCVYVQHLPCTGEKTPLCSLTENPQCCEHGSQTTQKPPWNVFTVRITGWQVTDPSWEYAGISTSLLCASSQKGRWHLKKSPKAMSPPPKKKKPWRWKAHFHCDAIRWS